MNLEVQTVSQATVAVVDVDGQLRSNAGAVLFDDFIVAVDGTMWPGTARTFRATLQDRYRRPVKYLCVTHYHGDHVFGLTSFKDAVIFASPQLAANMRQRMSAEWSPEAFAEWKQQDPTVQEWIDEVEFIIPPLLVHQRMDIADGDQIVEFHYVGGHTSCSVAAYYPSEKILFAGDLIFAERLPYAGDPTCDPEQWIAALKAWLKLDIARVIPGHGPVTDTSEIQRQVEFLERLKAATIDAIRAGKAPAEIVMPDTYTINAEKQWSVEQAQQRWHAYYSARGVE